MVTRLGRTHLSESTAIYMYSTITMSRNILLYSFLVLAVGLSISAEEHAVASLSEARDTGRAKSSILNKDQSNHRPTKLKADLASFKHKVEPVFKKSCINCHGPKKAKGKFRIDTLNPDLANGPDIVKWLEVFDVLSNAEMPPDDEPDFHLADQDRSTIIDWLATEIQLASQLRRNEGGHTSFRRMTKYEHNNALQDLLGVRYNFAASLPPESSSEDGFKNSSELLLMSGMHVQRYRKIGLKALKKATVGAKPPTVVYSIAMKAEMEAGAKQKKAKLFNRGDKDYAKNINGAHLIDLDTGRALRAPGLKPKPETITDASPLVLPAQSSTIYSLPKSGEIKLDLNNHLPDDGIMRVSIRTSRSSATAHGSASLRLALSAHTSNNANFSQVISERDMPVTAGPEKMQTIHFDIPLSEIQRNPFRKNEETFPRRNEFLHIKNISSSGDPKKGKDSLELLIDHIDIRAPFYAQWPPESHTAIFRKTATKDSEPTLARESLERFMRRAWRRPVDAKEVEPLMALYSNYRPMSDSMEEAMTEVLATVLAAPQFVYLMERTPPIFSRNKSQLSDLELATRMSFFLWSSIPDEELLRLAEKQTLSDSKILSAQVKRMLDDPRSQRFSQNFVSQWLGLEKIDSVAFDKSVYQNYKAEMKELALQEPVAFFNEVRRNKRSIMDFIHSDYAVVNDRLAKHYGIRDVYGPEFRSVALKAESRRGGIMTNASVLMMNSDGKDSSPLKRGIWLLERILNDPPPPAPPNVPVVDLTDPKILKMTLKERLADHRSKPACISCHAKIDPWGVAFENYDALGSYRTKIKNETVDATATLFNKKTLAGVDGLKHYLLTERQDQFAKAMVYKMTAYALGRPLSFNDRADIDDISLAFRKSGDRLDDLIGLIVSSRIFQSR
jgi:hypothetical protein